jgi:hypothetical protein
LPTEIQVQHLYAANIKQRVSQISAIAKNHNCNTKAILWGDMFDPLTSGGRTYVYGFQTLFSSGLQNNDECYSARDSLVKIQLDNCINLPEIRGIQDKLIFALWIYDTLNSGGIRYNPKLVLTAFTSIGYTVLYTCSSGAIFGFDSNNMSQFLPGTNAAIRNSLEFASAAQERKLCSRCIGYISANWSNISFVDSLQGGLQWNSDSNYIKPFNFMTTFVKIIALHSAKALK